MFSQFTIILPEIMLAVLALSTQLLDVFYKKSSRIIATITMILALSIIYYLLNSSSDYKLDFLESFATSSSIFLYKAFVLGFTLMSLLIYYDLMKITKSQFRIEFVTLVLLSTLGIFIAISSRDFILLFCGLELQALSGYALASFNTKQIKSSEAGLKYFILGALMSALMLMGISFLYGFSGSIKFSEVQSALNSELNIGLIVGSIFMLSAILFKLSAAPLHMWTPDVYEGAPISSVSYFSTAQKLGILIILINVIDNVIGDYTQISTKLIKVVAIISMIIGSLGAIMQSSLKRLMAYSTISNVGYVLIGIALQTPGGNNAAFVYMLIYIIGVIGFFACLVALFGSKADKATFEDLKNIATKRKTIAAAITIIMFSMIGLPPLAGFFGKYYIFYNAIAIGEITLAILGVLTSIIAAFYYLKVIKYMYFMKTSSDIKIIPTHLGLKFVTIISLAFILFFFSFGSAYIL